MKMCTFSHNSVKHFYHCAYGKQISNSVHTYQYEIARLPAFSWQLEQFSILNKFTPWFDDLIITQLGLQLKKLSKVILQKKIEFIRRSR